MEGTKTNEYLNVTIIMLCCLYYNNIMLCCLCPNTYCIVGNLMGIKFGGLHSYHLLLIININGI